MTVLQELRKQRLDRLLVPCRCLAQPHQTGVDDDSMQPGSKLRSPLEALQVPGQGEKGLLYRIPGILLGDISSSHRQQAAGVLPHQPLERLLVAPS